MSNAARVLAVRVAREYFDVEGPVGIARSDGGRPELVPPRGLFVSLSHSGSMVAVAVCREAVGVDVQSRRPVGPELIARYFAKTWEGDLDPADVNPIELWSCMESAAKLTGLGISRFLQEHALFREAFGWRIENVAASRRERLAVARVLWSDEGYVLSAACSHPDAAVEVCWFDADGISRASSS